MDLGNLPGPGSPTIWMIVALGPSALALGAGGGCLDIFTLVYPFSPLSPSQRAVKPKTTNQPTEHKTDETATKVPPWDGQ